MVKGLKLESDIWQEWSRSAAPEKNFPKKLMIRPVQKVLLIKVFRPDRLEAAVEDFICSLLQITNLNEAISSASSIFSIEDSPTVPILFITSLGSDPSKELEEFASSQIGRDKFNQLSMGGGQNQKAIEMLTLAAESGEWVFFKNLHLVPSFLQELEKVFKKLEPKRGFKLWLTTEEQPKFPLVLLESCFKVSYESPPGLKKNVERVYLSIPNSDFKKFETQKSKLIFLLAYFHALLQERRTYIPQGWSKYYEFSQSDFKTGSLLMETVYSEGKVDWDGLYGLMENAVYGGRIDKIADLEILKSYMKKIFNQEVLDNGKITIGEEHLTENQINIPSTKDLKEHFKVIAGLPPANQPELFGLPKIISNSVQKRNIQNCFNSLKSIGAGGTKGTSGGVIPAAAAAGARRWRAGMNKILQEGILAARIDSKEDPMKVAIEGEFLTRKKLLKKLDLLFQQLENVAEGKAGLTSELEGFVSALGRNKCPKEFEKIWDGTAYPDEWIDIFLKKSYNLAFWLNAAAKDDLGKEPLPLGAFLNPEIVFNALRQKTCRSTGASLDKLKMLVEFGLKSSELSLKVSLWLI